MIFLPFICSFICLYAPETGTLRLFSQTLHQKKGSHWLALTVFFVLSNSWVFLLIYATEEQIRRNNVSPSFAKLSGHVPEVLFLFAARFSILTRSVQVLPGEKNWGAGQILAMVLILIPLLGFVNVMLTSLGNHSTTARRWIKVYYLIQSSSSSYIDSWLSEDHDPQDDGHPLRASHGLSQA